MLSQKISLLFSYFFFEYIKNTQILSDMKINYKFITDLKNYTIVYKGIWFDC